jgi:heat shock protein HtpX
MSDLPLTPPAVAPRALPAGVVGLRTWIWRNNAHSLQLLIAFPALMAAVTFVLCHAFALIVTEDGSAYSPDDANLIFAVALPVVLVLTGLWFAIATLVQRPAILALAGAKLDDTSEDARRVRRLIEPLTISRGLPTPKVAIIASSGLNAFATGWSEKTAVVGVTSNLLATLDDRELEAVLAHEMTHIINRDTRLLIVSIVFVGVFAIAAELATRLLRGASYSKGDSKKAGQIMMFLLVAVTVLWLARLVSLALRFAISRKREFMADAGAIELTKNPDALVAALTKIEGNPKVEAVADEVQQMFIFDPPDGWSWFSTHPTMAARIAAIRAVG